MVYIFILRIPAELVWFFVSDFVVWFFVSDIVSCLVFQCLTLPDEFKRGKLLAYQLLCQTVVRRHDVPLPQELLSQFYMCLHAGIGSNDQVSHDPVRQMGFIAVFNAWCFVARQVTVSRKIFAPFCPHRQWANLKLGFFYIFINKKNKSICANLIACKCRREKTTQGENILLALSVNLQHAFLKYNLKLMNRFYSNILNLYVHVL